MRRTVLVLLLAAILGVGAVYAWMGFGGPPPGVSAEEWTQISSDLGLVVQSLSTGKVGGYLMMKVDGQWKRVVLYDPDTIGALPAR